jgi:CRP-like cAMP-binding protein
LFERYLAEQRFFVGLPPEFIAFLDGCAEKHVFESNQIVVRHGDVARSFYLVCEGRISREIPAIQGPGLVMHSVGRGEILGWSWLAPPYKWTFQARTEAPTEVIEFDANAVRSRCDSDPAFGYEIVKRFFAVMSQRLMQSRQKMMAEWSPPGFG